MPVKNTMRLSVWLLIVVAFVSAGCFSRSKDEHKQASGKQLYRCPMHHEIIRDKPGNCPICGMELVPFGGDEKPVTDVNLSTLLRPTNSYVVSSVPVTAVQESEEPIVVEALGTVQYDTRAEGAISARVDGRIEKLYLKHTFQRVEKGQKVMEIYSPELLTAQQNLLFLLKNDPSNTSFINAAKQKLLLLGVSPQQLNEIIRRQKPMLTLAVYSHYSGHVHDPVMMNGSMMPVSMAHNAMMATAMMNGSMNISALAITRDLMVKEGMYVQKGQTVLGVLNSQKLWAVLNIYIENHCCPVKIKG